MLAITETVAKFAFSPLIWYPKAVIKTGIVVKRVKKLPLVEKSGSNLKLCDLPSIRALIAITELMATKTKARRTAIAEVCLSESAGPKRYTTDMTYKLKMNFYIICNYV